MPGVDQAFREHPELKKQFMDATFKTMNSTAPTGQAPTGPAPQANGGMFGGLGNLMGNLFGGGGGQQNAEMPDMSSQMHGNMRGPTDVDDILNELKQDIEDELDECINYYASKLRGNETSGKYDKDIQHICLIKLAAYFNLHSNNKYQISSPDINVSGNKVFVELYVNALIK